MSGNKKRKTDAGPTAAVEVMEIKKADVPEYLQSGEFYRALGEDDGETFVVPSDAMKPDASITDADDLIYLLRSLRFWGVDGKIHYIVDFVLQNAETTAVKSGFAAFEADFPYLFTLRRILRNPINMRLDVAIETGDVEMVQYLTNKNVGPVFELTPKSTELAAKYGQARLLRFLHEQGVAWNPHVMCACIASGSLECAQYLHKHCDLTTQKMDNFSSTLITDANIDVFIYAYLNGVQPDPYPLVATLTSGGLKRLKYFQAQNFPFPPGLTAHCAHYGYVDQLKYLHSLGVPFDANACQRAAEFNQPKALKFLHENGAAWDAMTSDCAAAGGNLSCLKYCHEKGCPWDEGTTSAAVRANSLPCLKYAHEKGCPWSSHAYWKHTNEECLAYLDKHGCPKP